MSIFFLFAPLGSLIALITAFFLARKVLKESEGSDVMKGIAQAVREGANAYLKRQYSVVSIFFLFAFFVILILAILGLQPIFVPFAFLTGGFFSGLSGFIGMSIATRASSRTANGCMKGLNKGLNIAFSAGAVMGFVVVGLGLLDLSVWYVILNWYYGIRMGLTGNELLEAITFTMLSFGMGASTQALFARVGGGIFTKAADVGADLVGKIEANIPEDDPRNPAAIADNVGDNVGDVAGMGADLYESYVDSIVATMSLAASAMLGLKNVILPMIIAGIGIVSSVIGTFFVRTKENISQHSLLMALRKGIWISSVLIIILSFFTIRFLSPEHFNIFWALFFGLIAGMGIGLSTEFFTSDSYSPTRKIAKSSLTGYATNILEGLSVGMFSTSIPVIIVVISSIASFIISGGISNFSYGLYGIGLSAVGMLSTLGITLATDAYGPVADNAGGNAQMSGLPKEVRERTDALDALGNTTAATGKGFAIGSAALTALALIVSYYNAVELWGSRFGISNIKDMILPTLLDPFTIAGIFIGGMIPFLFCSLAIMAVGDAAGEIVEEVRRQIRELGILEGKNKPDYGRAVYIVTKAAQRKMILPSLLVIILPILAGFLLGPKGVIGLLTGALTSGFVVAIFMANAGGAWDNAKKFIEKGNYGGKGTDAHKASITGDTVGDPLKDTAGPSLNILIKLMSMVSIVFAGFVVKYSIIKFFMK